MKFDELTPYRFVELWGDMEDRAKRLAVAASRQKLEDFDKFFNELQVLRKKMENHKVAVGQKQIAK